MKALFTTAPGRMELRDVEPPRPPGSGEALLKVEAAGICGSDYALFDGKHPYSRFPNIQGHEFSARVVEYGPDADAPVPVGSRVAAEPLIACGRCYPCTQGRYNCCVDLEIVGVHSDGAFQEYLNVPARLLHDAGDLDAELAAFVEPMTIALQAVHRADMQAGEHAFVIGAGPIGQALLLALRAYGVTVAVSDLVESRLRTAAANGAELTVDGRSDVASALSAWTGGQGPAVVFDASGSTRAVRQAFDIVAAAGRIVIVGISGNELSVPMNTYTRKELTVLGSRNSARMFPEAIATVSRFKDEIRSIISHRIGLEDVQSTIELALSHPDQVEKAIVRF